MKSFVITITENDKSVESALRCISSGLSYGVPIEMWAATTPTNVRELFRYALAMGINPENFVEKWSRQYNCVAAFMSHYACWQWAVCNNKEVQIFEHDAVVVDRIPDFIPYKMCINLGKPSYGKFNTPIWFGVNPLTSKRYFPGAHAYRVNPKGAAALIEAAKIKAGPTDVFLNLDTFPDLEEYYPWPVEAHDTFTTIQRSEGCQAKHNFNSNYQII